MADSPQPALRASDADRDRVTALLRDNVAEGRLTLDEFSGRVDAAHAARTLGELEELTRDLPAVSAAPPRARREPTRWSVAVMGGVDRRNRWRVPERSTAVAVMGSVVLDLRQAEIESDVIEITALALMGSVEIVVPDGVEVEVTGIAIMGSKEERVADVPRLPGSPFVRVRAFALMGSVEVSSKRTGRRGGLPPLPPLPGAPRDVAD